MLNSKLRVHPMQTFAHQYSVLLHVKHGADVMLT